MWEKLRLNYQEPIFGRYGLVGYGCCENLTPKIDGVLSIPNLCSFVCSAWTCLEAMQDAVGQEHTITWPRRARQRPLAATWRRAASSCGGSRGSKATDPDRGAASSAANPERSSRPAPARGAVASGRVPQSKWHTSVPRYELWPATEMARRYTAGRITGPGFCLPLRDLAVGLTRC
jgi:hypothetical protein